MSLQKTISQIAAKSAYFKRPPPQQYAARWLEVELGNIQRGIPPVQVRTVFQDDRVTSEDAGVAVDATTGPVTITIPPPDQAKHLQVWVKKIDASANPVTLSQLVEGVTVTLAAQYDGITVVSTGDAWLQIG